MTKVPDYYKPDPVVTDILDQLEGSVKLTAWELGFIESVSDQIISRDLTDRQRDVLDRIYDEKG